MFEFKLSPRFIRRKQELLAQKTIPSILLPSTVEACLSYAPVVIPSVGRLWLECLGVVKPFLIKSVFTCFLIAICASGATVAGMQILKSNQSLEILIAFAGMYFVSNVLVQVGTFQNN